MPKHFHDKRVNAVALAAAAALSLATPAHAMSNLRAESNATVIATTLPADGDHRESHDASGMSMPLTATSQSLRAAGSATATAIAGYGLLGLVVRNSVNNALFPPAGGVSGASGNSTAYASFHDVLTINAPGLTGQRGTLLVPWTAANIGASTALSGAQPSMTGSADVHWQFGLSVSTTAYPSTTLTSILAFGDSDSYQLDTTIDTSTSHYASNGQLVQDSYSTTSGLVPALWSEISILFGVPLSFSGSMQAEALSGASNFGLATSDPSYNQARSAEAGADLGRMMRWGGITQVLNFQGQPVTGWSVRAESGTDYRYAAATVPEPATGLCMAAGLLAVALAWRKRRAAPAAAA